MKTRPLDELLGEHFSPNELHQIEERADKKLRQLLLSELRELTGKTQAEVAKKLGIQQPTLSKIESQADIKLSTLSGYTTALGGRLKVVIELPGQKPVVRTVKAFKRSHVLKRNPKLRVVKTTKRLKPTVKK